MKLVPMLSGVAIAVALSACAGKSAQVPVPAADPNGINTLSQQSIQQPNVSGTIWIKQRVALPPDAVLTVTLSDASLADAPSKVLAQRAVRTEGKQAPFSFVLPYNTSETILSTNSVFLHIDVSLLIYFSGWAFYRPYNLQSLKNNVFFAVFHTQSWHNYPQ